MLGVILFALFTTAAVAAAVVLADSFVRGREAFARLRRELAQREPAGRLIVTIADFGNCEGLPARHSSATRLHVIRRSEGRCRAPARKPELAAAA